MAAALIRVGTSEALRDGGPGLRFEVEVAGRVETAFAVRHRGAIYGYLNRCANVAMELDWQVGMFFDSEGQWLTCATHGALYEPHTGRCAGGPCLGRGGLRRLTLVERDGAIYWQPDDVVRAVSGTAAPTG